MINFGAQYKRYTGAIARELLVFANNFAGRIQEKIEAGTTGNLRGSFEPSLIETKQGTALQVGTPLEYGSYYEFGTAPHFAPIAPIAKWVEGKIQPHVLSVGVDFSSGKRRITRKGTKVLKGAARQNAVMRVAFAIRAKIAKVGTKAHRPMERTLQEFGIQYQLASDGHGMYYAADMYPIVRAIAERVKNEFR